MTSRKHGGEWELEGMPTWALDDADMWRGLTMTMSEYLELEREQDYARWKHAQTDQNFETWRNELA